VKQLNEKSLPRSKFLLSDSRCQKKRKLKVFSLVNHGAMVLGGLDPFFSPALFVNARDCDIAQLSSIMCLCFNALKKI
jgi:hypothetical protein